jgi:hypothetical protein
MMFFSLSVYIVEGVKCGASFLGALIPTMLAKPFKGPNFNIIMLGTRVSTYRFCGNTDIQTIMHKFYLKGRS